MEFGNVAWGQSIDEAWRDEGAPPRSPCSSLHYKRKKKCSALSLPRFRSVYIVSVSACYMYVCVLCVSCVYIYISISYAF